MTEVYLMFYLASLQLFVKFNKFLQREDPIIGIISSQIKSFIINLFGKFLTIRAIKAGDNSLTNVQFRDNDNQLPDSGVHIGFSTRSLLLKHLNNGDISDSNVKQFYKAVREFYMMKTECAISNLPLSDEVLPNASFTTFDGRENVLLSQVQFFVKRYTTHLPFQKPSEMDLLKEEFISYQLLEKSSIPAEVWKSAVINEGSEQHQHRMDIIWNYLSTARNNSGNLMFSRLSKVALLVLVIPHSNAEEERVFSLVTKNKTVFRPNLKLDGTLSSILQIKLANPEPCYKYEPDQTVLEDAKHATAEYNKLHCNK
jgi:hypothetical protein